MKIVNPFLTKLKNRSPMHRVKSAALKRLRKWGDPVLSEECRPVKSGQDVSRIVANMLETMQACGNGVGLAAPQIGVTLRIIVIAPSKAEQPIVMVNPEISVWGDKVIGNEGCLSYPDIYTDISRFNKVTAMWFDPEDVAFRFPQSGVFEGWPARIIQHEFDHLNGICLVGDYWKRTK